MKVERSVDRVRSCHDGLRDDLTPKDAYQITVPICEKVQPVRVAHLSLLEEAANPWTGRG